jgi:hypothetical protein
VVGADEGVGIVTHQRAGQRQRLVGLLIGAADEFLARLDPTVLGAVEVDVVVGRVGRTAGQCGRDEPEELVLELVGGGHADEKEVGLVGPADVLQHRQVASGPVPALLDVGLLAHDAGFEHREVGRRRGGEGLGEVLGEVAGEPRLPGPRRPRGESPSHRRVEQAHAR